MSHAPSRFLVAALLALGACSGGGGDGASEAPDGAPSDPETTAPAAPARIDLSQPIPGGSLHGTPRPPLENTGDDYVAIFESLMANLRWISENPDVAAISEIFMPGTAGHDVRVRDYQYLVDNGYRWADEGYHLISAEVFSQEGGAVTLKVVQQLEFERVVDGSGAQVGDVRAHDSPDELTFLLVRDAVGRWRIADSTRLTDSVVEL